jgi:general secretion pathway protein J
MTGCRTATTSRRAVSPARPPGHRWRVDVLPFYADFVDPEKTGLIPASVVVRVQSLTGPDPAAQHRAPAAEAEPNERAREAALPAHAGFTLISAARDRADGRDPGRDRDRDGAMVAELNRGFERVQRVELLAAGLERIVADIAAAEFVTAGANIRQPIFDGTELSVTFLRTALGPNTRPGLELVRIGEVPGERGLTTVRTRARFVPIGRDGIETQPRPSDPVVLVRAPYRITFSYAGPDRVWRSVWRGEGQLPSAVRVQLRDAATDRTLSVSTATLVHAEMPTDCVLSEVINDCLNPHRSNRRANHAGTPSRPSAMDVPQRGIHHRRYCGFWWRWRRSPASWRSRHQRGDRIICMTSGCKRGATRGAIELGL